jgi:hypothetical protein
MSAANASNQHREQNSNRHGNERSEAHRIGSPNSRI